MPVYLPRESHGQRTLAGYKSIGSLRVGHDWSDVAHIIIHGETSYYWPILWRGWWLLHSVYAACSTQQVCVKLDPCGPELLSGRNPCHWAEGILWTPRMSWYKELVRTLAVNRLGRFPCSQRQLRSSSWVLPLGRQCSPVSPLRVLKPVLGSL